MTPTPGLRTIHRAVAATIAVVALAAGVLVAPTAVEAGLGSGRPSVSVSSTTVSAERPTQLTVRGTDFLVPPHDCPNRDVFGGVYVMFGWVSSPTGWGPSNRSSESRDGVFGYTYAYPGEGGDANIRDDGSGIVRLVSFTAGGESGAATPFHMDCKGDWSTSMTIPAPVFEYVIPSTGEARTIDCRALASGQCGILSIGAHGKASATNEIFVPITFAASGPTTPGDPSAPSTPTDDGPTGGGPGGGGTPGGGSTEVVEEVVEIESPFETGSDDGGFPGIGDVGDAASSKAGVTRVPGVTGGAPVAIAVAGSPTMVVEPAEVSSIGRRPRWLIPTAAAVVLLLAAGTVVRRQRNNEIVEVAT